MTPLALKFVLTPALIAIASVAGRRFGPAIGGWLVGIPFTSGPIALFLALDRGEAFAAVAAAGILAGTVSQAAHALAYAHVASRARWPLALAAATAAFIAVSALFIVSSPPLAVVLALAVGSLLIAIPLMPRSAITAERRAFPSWDLPARMLIATAIVLAVTEAAPLVGPFVAGLLSPYPIYATVLAAFAHEQQGPAAATQALRGLLLGLFAFVGFFLVLAIGLVPLGVGPAFLIAAGVLVALQGLSFRIALHGRSAERPQAEEQRRVE